MLKSKQITPYTHLISGKPEEKKTIVPEGEKILPPDCL